MTTTAPRRSRRRTPRPAVRRLGGAALLVVMAVIVVISYNASHGLPFQSRYALTVEVPNAAELNPGDPVQIGGARVGLVQSITAAQSAGTGPFARIAISVSGGHRLPVDSTVSVRALSILGAKVLVLEPGRADTMLAPGATLPLAQARPAVDLNDALSAFGPATRGALRGTITGLADGVAGRGDDLNDLLANLPPALGSLRAVAANLAAPATDLPGFIDSADALFRSLDPVAATVPSLLDHTATTFDALLAAQPAFGGLLDQLPAAEARTTSALRQTAPALHYLDVVARGLSGAGPLLRPALSSLDTALAAGPGTLQLSRRLGAPLASLAGALRRALPPQSDGLANSLAGLDVTVRAVDRVNATVGPAQEVCNVLGTTLRNGASVISEGDADGAWFTFLPLVTPFLLPTGSISANTHVNDRPLEDARGCAAGNAPYLPGPQLGNPAASALSTAHDTTVPPAVATQRARAAGLLTPAPGARLG